MNYVKKIMGWFKRDANHDNNKQLLEVIKNLETQIKTQNSRLSLIVERLNNVEKNQINLTSIAEQILFVSSGSFDTEDQFTITEPEIIKYKMH